MAYFEGPDRYHASYSIRVKKKNIKNLREELSNETDLFHDDDNEFESYTQFSALVRINETASKVYNFEIIYN